MFLIIFAGVALYFSSLYFDNENCGLRDGCLGDADFETSQSADVVLSQFNPKRNGGGEIISVFESLNRENASLITYQINLFDSEGELAYEVSREIVLPPESKRLVSENVSGSQFAGQKVTAFVQIVKIENLSTANLTTPEPDFLVGNINAQKNPVLEVVVSNNTSRVTPPYDLRALIFDENGRIKRSALGRVGSLSSNEDVSIFFNLGDEVNFEIGDIQIYIEKI